jgi:phosphate uptake regulator
MKQTPKEEAVSFVNIAFKMDKALDMQFPICDRKNLFEYISQNIEEAIDIAISSEREYICNIIDLMEEEVDVDYRLIVADIFKRLKQRITKEVKTE